jgi:hypothetical protein
MLPPFDLVLASVISAILGKLAWILADTTPLAGKF